MTRVRIVTDSTALFEIPSFPDDYHVVIVPVNVHFGDRVFQDGINITAEDVLQRMHSGGIAPRISAPPAATFEQIFRELNKSTDQIIVLLHSQYFSDTVSNAQVARLSLLGRCEIAVVDSMTTSVGLGYLVETIAEASERGADLDEIVRIARGVIPRLYSIYYVESLDTIHQTGLIGRSQSLLGSMLEIKPILTIEDGNLMTMEKARTHSQAIDKMIEFITEFTHLERLSIVQNSSRITDRTRMLQDRLALEFARTQVPVMVYEPLIASMLGPDAMGLAILEGNYEEEFLD